VKPPTQADTKYVAGASRGRRAGGIWLKRFLILGVAACLLWLAFRRTPLSEIIKTLALVQPWQVAVVLAINILFHILMGLRWWFLARDDVKPVRLVDMVLVRLSAFGISYFTPGPQLGGEPLQILFLRRQHGASLARAAATVIMDRLVELLAGFIFMLLGIASLLREGLLHNVASVSPAVLIPLALLMGWPLAHILLLGGGFYPISRLLRLMPAPRALRKFWRLTRAAEHLAGGFCQRRPRAVLAGLAASLLAPILAVMEYALITSFLGMRLTPGQVMAGWTAGWLSFLVPLPGALGALEGSQIIALGSFGITRAAALSAALLLRSRDVLFGGAGFVLAARFLHQAGLRRPSADAA
jgi:hypothetical protein